MSMKKNISKALAMAVMMSVWCGSAYAAYTDEQINGFLNAKVDVGFLNNTFAIAVGKTSTASEMYTTAVGSNANASDIYGTAIGFNAEASNEDSSALGALASATGENSLALGYRAQAQGENSVALGAKSVAAEDNVVSVGAEGSERKIVNVAEGTNDTDAVNKKQLDDAIAAGIGGASTAALEKLDSKINQTNDRVDRVGATAAALAGIHYQPMAKGQSQVAIGMGGYKGKKATALGLAYQISDRISGSVAGAANGSEHMFNVGFNYLFGQHSDKDIAQCAAVPGSVSLKEAELQSEVDSLKAENQAMQARMAQLEAMVKTLAAK